MVTNQVQSQPDDFFSDGNGLRPTGGNVMAHATTYRIMLRKAGKTPYSNNGRFPIPHV
ncbi:MAG: hypothetical protein WA364_25310 [Candidatus Nitrosopolaris sp.]